MPLVECLCVYICRSQERLSDPSVGVIGITSTLAWSWGQNTTPQDYTVWSLNSTVNYPVMCPTPAAIFEPEFKPGAFFHLVNFIPPSI